MERADRSPPHGKRHVRKARLSTAAACLVRRRLDYSTVSEAL